MKSKFLATLLALGCVPLLALAQQEIYVQKLQTVQVFDTSVVAGTIAGTRIAVTSAAKSLKILETPGMKPVLTYPVLPNSLVFLAFTKDKRLLTTRPDGQVNYWDPAQGTMVKSITAHAGGISDCAMYPDGSLLILGLDNTVKIFDPENDKELASATPDEERGNKLAVRPDGKLSILATASSKILVLDSSLAAVHTIGDARETATALAFSNDGAFLASGGIDGTIRLWETATWTLKATKNTQKGSIRSLTFDPRSQWIASVSADSTLIMYDRTSLGVVKRLREPDAASTFVAFQSPETMISADTRGRVTSWRVLERAPDTTAPTLTILQPSRFSQEAPTKIYAPSYNVLGIVYDESAIKDVLVGDQKAVLTEPKVQNATASQAGLRGKEFTAKVTLPKVGLNLIEVKATDASGNTAVQPLYIERLSAAQAVEILSPTENAETERVAVEVDFKPWFEVASYSISANTIELISSQGPVKIKPGDVIKEEVPLIVGYNQIALNIVSKQGERFSKLVGVNRKFSAAVAEVIRRPAASKGAAGPQQWAVIVGVSEYANKGIPALKYADKDAESIAAFLQSPEGGSFPRDHMRILINNDATLSNLREAMIDFLQQAIDKDIVFIYFAGHGAPDPTRPQNLYLLTYDADPNRLGTTAFPMWDIQTVVSRQIAAKKVVVFSDACHSGGISVDVATRGLDVTSANPINQYLAELSRAKDGMVVFTASAAGEVSQEFPELGHGVFTYYLLEGLKGAADANNDYVVTVNELMGYVEEQVKRKTRGAQNPTRSQTTYDKELPMAVINK